MNNHNHYSAGQSLIDKIKEGEPLMTRALDALRQYNEAQGTQSEDEVRRLRLEAEALFTKVNEYQRQALSKLLPSLHRANPEFEPQKNQPIANIGITSCRSRPWS